MIILICNEIFKSLRARSPFQALRSFKVTMSVDPKFHPKIIGRKGAVISQIRKDHDVSIQFPDKGDEQQVCVIPVFWDQVCLLIVFPLLQPTSHVLPQDLIVISGYERNVEEARQAIQLLVAELQEMVSQEVHLDPRTHARIIGARGKAIRKLMEEFKVRECYSLCAPNCRTCSFALFQPLVLMFRWILGSLSQAPTSRIK